MITREYKAKEVIFKEGEHGDSLFVISEGTVEIYVRYGESDQQKIKTLTKNQTFGEMAVIEYYPRSATAVAADDVKVIEVKCGEISAFFKSDPDKIIQIMRQLSLRIRELTADYNVVVDLVDELKAAAGVGKKKNASLAEKIKKFVLYGNKQPEFKSVESIRKIGEVSHSDGFTLKVESFPKGTVLFKEGEAGKCMYDIHSGQIGIYKNYGTPDEILLTKLSENQFFGEMAMLDDDKRSATAVIISNEATVESISSNDLKELFENNPLKVEMIVAHMSSRLRKLTNEYIKSCELFNEFYNTEIWDEHLAKKAEEFSIKYYD